MYRGHAGRFARTVAPGRIGRLRGRRSRRCKRPGQHLLHADLLDAQPIDLLDTDFAQYGSEPLDRWTDGVDAHGCTP